MKKLKKSHLKCLFIIVLLFFSIKNLAFSAEPGGGSVDSTEPGGGSVDSAGFESPQQENSSTQFQSGKQPVAKKPVANQPYIKKNHSQVNTKKPLFHGKKTRKFKKTPKKPTFLTIGGEKLFLFQWVNEQQVALQWAYSFLNQIDKLAPSLLQKKINESFRNDTLFYFNFHQNIIQFPYILKWGLKASAGITRNYDIDGTYFTPISLSAMVGLQIFKNQIVVPFFEIGYSFWGVDFFSESSDFFPFWSVGADISLSIFKKSLRYTLPDEYGIKDIGISLEFRNNSSPMDFSEEKRGYFLRSIHAGIYCRF